MLTKKSEDIIKKDKICRMVSRTQEYSLILSLWLYLNICSIPVMFMNILCAGYKTSEAEITIADMEYMATEEEVSGNDSFWT